MRRLIHDRTAVELPGSTPRFSVIILLRPLPSDGHIREVNATEPALIYGALALFLLAMISRKITLGFSMPLMLHLMRFGLPLILVAAGWLTIQGSAMYSVSYFRGLEDAGIYSLGMKMAQVAEMVLILPPELGGGRKQWVCCRASVVRVLEADSGTGFGVAASIESMEVLPEITE